ncbi:MAG: glycosyltransferase family 4 protein [Desulfovibrio sp.]|jgi:glycosyltransferase involved in cell wall biosynthesis|nr:glycosyltransferase family 4 protein [Desulfovibrio sp.]
MREKKIWASLHPFFEGGSMLGRREANRRFLTALLENDPFDAYHFFLSHPDVRTALEDELRALFPDLLREDRISLRLHAEFPAALGEHGYHCLHLSDPFSCFTEAMCLRNVFSRRIFPITAPTHSLSYAEFGGEFLKHLWGGVTARDAVAATSTAGAEVVRAYYARLRDAYALDEERFAAPSVRCVPLGVDPSLMPAPDEKRQLGAACRSRLGLGDKLVFLVFARIAYQSKMDLLPVLRAWKRAEEYGMPRGRCALVLAGWVEDGDTFDKDIAGFAANMGIGCLTVPRPDNAGRKALYAAADVFLSPSDNLQETFGLTLLEAAASCLPVIASDFDGYRDLVSDGESGILVPIVGPARTPRTDALARIVPAAAYHLMSAQQSAVDVEALGRAIHLLAGDETLRRRMGETGRQQVLAGRTWRHVVRNMLDLWAELNETPCPLPENPGERRRCALVHPSCPPHTDIFSGYYTLRADDPDLAGKKLVWSKAGKAVYHGRDFPVVYRPVEEHVDPETLRKLLFTARKPTAWAELAALCAAQTKGPGPSDGEFMLLWALKHDFLEFAASPPGASGQPAGLAPARADWGQGQNRANECRPEK